MKSQFTLILFWCLIPAVGLAQTSHNFDVAAGNWEEATSWDTMMVPADGDNAFINNGGMCSLSSDTALLLDLGVAQGVGATGTLNQSAGTISSADGWIRVGVGKGAMGSYTMSGTASISATHANPDDQRIYVGGANGEIGNAILTMTDDASISTNGWFNLAHGNGGAIAVLNIADNASISANTINLGHADATVTVNQTGGSVTSNNWIGISNFGGGNVEYNISGGSLISAADFMSVGENAVGTLNISGTAIVEANGTAMSVGREDNSTGILNITGSQATINVTFLTLDALARTNNSAAVNWIADANGVSPINSASSTEFGDDVSLSVDLTALSNWVPSGAGDSTMDMLLISNSTPVQGTFTGLAEGDVVPGTNGATITYVGGRVGTDIYLEGIPISSGPVVVVGQSLNVSPGLQNAGGLPELAVSDNMDLQIFRDPLSINAVTQFELTATSPTATPTTFDFTLEGNCISRPNVVQRIQLFNFVTNAYETVDERNANRAPNPDLVVTVSPGGDLSRFVEPSTLVIRAQIRYRADIARAGFASNTDQAVWTIQ